MRFNRKSSRYRFFDAKSQQPVPADDGKQKGDGDTPKKDDSAADDDLKNIDKSKGGYGHGSGFDNNK